MSRLTEIFEEVPKPYVIKAIGVPGYYDEVVALYARELGASVVSLEDIDEELNIGYKTAFWERVRADVGASLQAGTPVVVDYSNCEALWHPELGEEELRALGAAAVVAMVLDPPKSLYEGLGFDQFVRVETNRR